VLEGPKIIEAALDRGVPIETVYFASDARRAFSDLDARLQAAGVAIAELKSGVLEKVGTTVTPQPVLAVVATTLVALADRAPGLSVFGVELQDPGNVGAILRSAEAAGATALLLTGDSVDPFNPKVVRASAGAVFGIPIIPVDDAAGALRSLRASGARCLGTTMVGGVPYDQADLGGDVVLVFGNEAHGLPASIDDALDGRLTIPMAGAAESLNVAMAASILAFESARQRRSK
jgi:TrmH family RNA methyltransferase